MGVILGVRGVGREEYLASTQGRTSVRLPAFHYAHMHTRTHTEFFSNNVGATRQLPFPKLKNENFGDEIGHGYSNRWMPVFTFSLGETESLQIIRGMWGKERGDL